MGVFDLEDQLVFYRSYHYNLVNVFIHLFFIPTIFFTAIVGVTSVKFNELPIDEPLNSFLKLHVWNLGGILIIGYLIFYIILDKIGGTIYSIIIITITYFLQKLYETYPSEFIVKRCLTLHCLAWIAQFFGHGAFEHRAPALLDNLLQPLVLAPFFVFYEILFYLGFRKDLKLRMDTRAQEQIRQFQSKKQK